jgi:hypothetical protein
MLLAWHQITDPDRKEMGLSPETNKTVVNLYPREHRSSGYIARASKFPTSGLVPFLSHDHIRAILTRKKGM